MAYHLVLSKNYDLAAIATEASMGQRPRHVLWEVAQQLQATIHTPRGSALADMLRSRLFSGEPAHWELARRLARSLRSADVIYCQSDGVGIPVAALCGGRATSPKIVVSVDYIDRPRARLGLKYMGFAKSIDLWLPLSVTQAEFIHRYLGVPTAKIRVVGIETDTNFFSPGPPLKEKARPIIASVGLEQRDFRVLAKATADLDVDVKLTAYSANVKLARRAFPDQPPVNMSSKYYSWLELLQLYRDADVVAITLFENNYLAGITTFLEALACQRPVVVTKTQGLTEYLDRHPVIALSVPPNDPQTLRTAIDALLGDRDEAKSMAERGREIVLRNYSSDKRVALTVEALRAVGMETRDSSQSRPIS